MTPEDFAALDLDTAFDKVRGSGAEVIHEPVSQPRSAPHCSLRDPSRTLVRIAPA